MENASAKPRDQVVRLSGNRAIALRCDGKGKFTILLKPGDGGRRTHMPAVFAALSTYYHVCEYDRRNVGNSSVASLTRRASNLTAGSERQLKSVRPTIAQICRDYRDQTVGIIIGGPMFTADPALAQDVGAGATAPNAASAVILAQKLFDLAASELRDSTRR